MSGKIIGRAHRHEFPTDEQNIDARDIWECPCGEHFRAVHFSAHAHPSTEVQVPSEWRTGPWSWVPYDGPIEETA